MHLQSNQGKAVFCCSRLLWEKSGNLPCNLPHLSFSDKPHMELRCNPGPGQTAGFEGCTGCHHQEYQTLWGCQVWSSCPRVTVISVAVAGTLLLQKEQRIKFHRHSVLAGCCSLYFLDFTIRLLFREDVVKYKASGNETFTKCLI